MKGINGPGKFYARECDITKQEDVNDTFEWIKKTVGTGNILINNAGVLREGSLEGIDKHLFLMKDNLFFKDCRTN